MPRIFISYRRDDSAGHAGRFRPHHNFGTVEVRMCDMPARLDHVLALTALVQCMVVAISNEIDGGTYQHDYHPMMVQQNKWHYPHDLQVYSPFWLVCSLIR